MSISMSISILFLFSFYSVLGFVSKKSETNSCGVAWCAYCGGSARSLDSLLGKWRLAEHSGCPAWILQVFFIRKNHKVQRGCFGGVLINWVWWQRHCVPKHQKELFGMKKYQAVY